MSTPLLVDTDMALDDWMALAFLLQSPAADVRAITVAASGESHAGPGMRTALRLLAQSGRSGVEVAAGRKRPLRGDHRFPLLLRLVMDLRFGVSLPRSSERPSRRTAVEVLSEKLAGAQEPVVMISLGPLTNLAELFDGDPSLVRKVAMLYVMGGALDVPGNLAEIEPRNRNRHAEWNVYIDPHAAGRVLRSGVPLTLVPLDATNQVPLTDQFFARLEANRRSAAADYVFRLVRRIRPLLSRERNLCFWDPLAAVLALHPDVGRYTTRTLRVIEEEGEACGRVLDDPAGAPVRVCTGVDQQAFETLFLDGLNGADASAPATTPPARTG